MTLHKLVNNSAFVRIYLCVLNSKQYHSYFYYNSPRYKKKLTKKQFIPNINRLKYNFIFNNIKGFTNQDCLTPSQDVILFIKRKFGLYKTKSIFNKKQKKKLYFIRNFVTNKPNRLLNSKHIKRVKILYYKRMKKLYYRDGRAIFMDHVNLKKQFTQEYISKRITTFLKKNILILLRETRLYNVLTKTGIFLSASDAKLFIKNVGVVVNNKWIFDINFCLKVDDFFKLISTKFLLKYLQARRKNILVNLKRIKFYNYRSKFFFFKKKYMWIPTRTWIENHIFLYTNRYNNVEFDLKTLTGFYLYDADSLNPFNFYRNIDLSLYMVRSYNWKYIV